MVKNPAAVAGDTGSVPGLGKIPWRRERLPHSGLGHKESNMAELNTQKMPNECGFTDTQDIKSTGRKRNPECFCD